MKTKNIKVVYTYRHHQSGGVLHSGTGPCTAVPKIQMGGHWLEALGFSIGAPLIVEYEEGSIHIRTLTAEELAAKEQREAQAELEKKDVLHADVQTQPSCRHSVITHPVLKS